MLHAQQEHRGWARSLFPVVALTGGTIAGFVLLIAVLMLSGWGGGGAAWDTPALMDFMDCSEASICRHFPSRDMQVRDGAGGFFQVTSNSIGFRNPEPPPTNRDEASLVIQLYGDSMIHGTGVDDEDTIAMQVQSILAKRYPAREVYVMNFGMPMNYLASQVQIYKSWGRAYDPDIVVFEYHGNIPSPRDINYRVKQIRESRLAGFLFRFALGRSLINRYQTWSIGRYDRDDALDALRPGLALVDRDRRDRGLRIAVFSFVSEFGDLDAIFPNDIEVVRIGSGLHGWDGYGASEYIIQGDGHPNPTGTRMFAEKIAQGLLPILPKQ